MPSKRDLAFDTRRILIIIAEGPVPARTVANGSPAGSSGGSNSAATTL
jgi:hypothetical protein